MKHTQLLIITHRTPHEGTKTCIEECALAGAKALLPRGYADISSGRSTEITRCMDMMVERGWSPTEGVLGNIDDDMHFSVAQVQLMTDYVRKTGRPASGVYGGSNGRIIANNQDGCEWEVGGGFLFIRLDHLQRVAERLGRVRGMYERGIVPFSCSGVYPDLPDRYTGDDFWLCRELGGVDIPALERLETSKGVFSEELYPVGVGHYKSIPLFPDALTLGRIAKSEKLPGTVAKRQPQGRRLALHAASKEYDHCGHSGIHPLATAHESTPKCIRAKGHKGEHSSSMPEQEFPDAEHPEGWVLS